MRVTLQLPDGRIITKNFGHHGIMEIRNGQPTVYMFPDNPPHLQIYAYSLGLGRQRFRAGFELEKNLPKLMLATRRAAGDSCACGTRRGWSFRSRG
jgi:hypothetical protein